MAGTVFSLLFTVILGRTYGAEGTGFFYIYRSWTDILGNQLTGNYQVYVTRKAVFFQEQGRIQTSTTFVKVVVTGVALVSLLLIGGLFALPVYKLISAVEPRTARLLLLLAGGSGAFCLILQNLSAGLLALDHARTSLLLQYVVPSLAATLGLALLIIFAVNPGPISPALVFTMGLGLTSLAALLIWRRVEKQRVVSDLAGPVKGSKQDRARLGFSDFVNNSAFVFLVAGWISLSLENLPFYLLSIVGSLKAIAYYGIADRLVSISSTVLISLGSDYLPRFSRLYAQRDMGRLRKEFIKSQFFSFLLFSPFLAAYLLFPREILRLFGEGFVAAVPYLFILLVGDAVNAATGPTGALLYAMGDEIFVLRFRVFSLPLLGLSLFLGWITLGGLGVALAASTLFGIRNAVCLFRALYLLRRHNLEVQ